MGIETIEQVAVIGAGRMGHGIALVYALAGNDVTLYDIDESVLERSRKQIDRSLATLVDASRITEADAARACDHIARESAFDACVRDADFVTEAVAEDLEIKQEVFEQLDEHTREDAILATNTSGLSIDDIARPVANQSRILGTHWFNPPYIVPLVELIKGSATTDATVAAIDDLLDDAGKTPVVVEKDIPGFIGNRIQAAMSYEAFSLLARGVATPEDIDKAVKAGFGFRLPVMGIFEKMDQSGLAIHHEVEKQLLPTLDRGTDPNAVVTELLARDETGMDAGKGIYDWTDVDHEAVERTRDRLLLGLADTYEEAAARNPPPANYDRTGQQADSEIESS